jgi:hypothetical protein
MSATETAPPGANVTEIRANVGGAAAVDQPRRSYPSLKLAKRVVTISLADVDPVYDGMEFTAWTNFPPELRDDFQSDKEERRLGALTRIIQTTNFTDEDGQPFLSPQTLDFWKAIPDDLAVVMIRKTAAQVGSLTPTNAGK